MSAATNKAKTIAIWYESSQGNIQSGSLDLHFNLWKLPKGGGYHRFLDIGIKLHNPADVQKLCIYFPFDISAEYFEDIVDKFITDSSLVSAIFNENYTVASEPQSKSHLIKKGNTELFDIYQTGPQNVKRESKFGGTVFKLDFQQRGKPLYMRFRVSGAYPDSISTTQKAPNAIVQSAFSQTEMIDFRVNEARDLDKDLLEEMRKQSSFCLETTHFFFVCSYGEDIVGAHEQYKSCRNLENYRWAKYVGNEELNNQVYLAYQWKKEKKNDFNVLIRTKFERSNIRILITYFLFLLLITVLFNIISSYVFTFLTTTAPPAKPCAYYSPSSPNSPLRFLTGPKNLSSVVQYSRMLTLKV